MRSKSIRTFTARGEAGVGCGGGASAAGEGLGGGSSPVSGSNGEGSLALKTAR